MAQADWHTFQVLTKRPARLARLVPKITATLTQQTNQTVPWPAHIWLGISVETLQYKWRVDELRKVPAAIRFVSAEPLLGSLEDLNLWGVDWLIAGGESGPGHRPCNPDWIRELRDKCQREDVAFFFKQWGGRAPKSNGRILDGRTWDEYPELAKEKEMGQEAA
jgi:protein gp37